MDVRHVAVIATYIHARVEHHLHVFHRWRFAQIAFFEKCCKQKRIEKVLKEVITSHLIHDTIAHLRKSAVVVRIVGYGMLSV